MKISKYQGYRIIRFLACVLVVCMLLPMVLASCRDDEVHVAPPKQTEGSTQKSTEKPTQPPTEKPSEHISEDISEDISEKLTEAPSETVTESPSAPPTVDTEAPTEAPTAPPEEHVHAFGEWTVKTYATCGEAGLEVRTCECGESEKREIPKIPHIYSNVWSYNENYHWHSTACEHVGEFDKISPHEFGEWSIYTSPTCSEDGIEIRYCICGRSEIRSIPKTQHTFGEWIIERSATCDGEGLEARICMCGEREEREIPKTPHTYSDTWSYDSSYHWHEPICQHSDAINDISAHSFGEWTVIEPATCDVTGREERACVCGYTESRDIPLVGHTYGEWMVEIPATCSAEGLEVQICACGERVERVVPKTAHAYSSSWSYNDFYHWHASLCGHTDEKNDLTAHEFGEWSVVIPVTCESNGKEERICICGKKETRTISSTSHTFGEWIIEKPATCGEEGLEIQVCACGERVERVIQKTEHTYADTWSHNETQHWYTSVCEHVGEKKDVSAHEFGEWVTLTLATCDTNGTEERTCVCGRTETRTVRATGHTFGEWIIEKPATCGEEGLEIQVCACGERVERVIQKTEHTYADTWSHNETQHWYTSVCEHVGNKKDIAVHYDGNKDGVCDVCQYADMEVETPSEDNTENPVEPPHEHTYSDTWSHNETQHWRESTCEHTDQMGYLGDHVYGEWSLKVAPDCESDGTEERACMCGRTETRAVPATGHTFGEWTTEIPATCGSEGLKVRVCACGEKQENVLDKLPHTYSDTWSYNDTTHWYATTCEHVDEITNFAHAFGEWVTETPATCILEGRMSRTCICGKTEYTSIPKADHEFGDWATEIPATCGSEGLEVRVCACGERQENALKKLPHTYSEEWSYNNTNHWHASLCGHSDEINDVAAHTFSEWVTTVLATCTTDGQQSHSCACGFAETRVVPKTGHTFGAWVTETAATCTEKGLEVRVCVCGERQENVLETLPHTYSDIYKYSDTQHWLICICGQKNDVEAHEFGAWEVQIPVSCEKAGINKRTCKCGHFEREVVLKTGHTFGDWVLETPPSCGNEGLEVKTCHCGEREENVLSKLPHTYSEGWSYNNTSHWHASTCGHPDETKDVEAHTFSEWVTTTPATCTTDGQQSRSCMCGAVETRAVSKTGHTFSAWETETAATCTENGLKVRTCACGERQENIIPATGHKYDTAWSYDSTSHWHKPICGCELENADTGAHYDKNNDGKCEVCPYDEMPKSGINSEKVIITKVFGTGGRIDAVMRDSFIELYNPTDSTAVLDGTAIYYSDGVMYNKLDLSGYSMPAKTYLLIKCASVEGYQTDFEVFRIDEYDIEWNVTISNKVFELVYGMSNFMHMTGQDLEIDGVYSYLTVNEIDSVNVNHVHNLSKNRMIVRTDVNVEGYHKVNLKNAGTSDLVKITPCSSKGNVNTYISSKFDEVLFSQEGGVYNTSSIKLTLTAPEGWTIYYTTNGDDPREAGSTVYAGEISLGATNSVSWGDTINLGISRDSNNTPGVSKMFGGHVIKAYATNGTDSTAVYTQSYFVGYKLANLDVKVISMSVDAEDLLGTGGAYYDFPLFDKRPRTRVFIEMFGTDGVKAGGSYAEVAVNGVGSSGLPMKSMRVYYKDPLDLNDPALDSLEYDLFEGRAQNSMGQTITTFDRILLRNSGNDFGRTLLRDAYSHRIASRLNVDYLEYEPVFVFINGEFWGMYNLRERYSPEYFNQHYGVLENNVVILENESPLKYDASQPEAWNTDYVATTGDELIPHDAYAQEFNDLVAYIKANDLSVSEHYNYVADRIDIDSFIDYWIINTYLCNPDWPGNNIKVWRNLSADDPSGMHTKWRFLILDMDSTMNAQFNSAADWDKFLDISENTRCGAIMSGLCENQAFKDRFLARAEYLVQNELSSENCISTLDAMQNDISPLVKYQYERYPTHGSYSNWKNEIEVAREFLRQRAENYLVQLQEHFG